VTPPAPINVVPLFPELHQQLIELLRGLPGDAWNRPTAAPRWQVRDVAAHLLDTQIRTLAIGRDGIHPPPPETPITNYPELVAYLNRLNAEWVQAARRIGPKQLIQFLEMIGPQVAAYYAGLDPTAPALFPVDWAGDRVSPNWFDLAREYTEQWHHQEQIRDATGAPPLTARKWLHPVLDTSVRALPHAYRKIEAAPDTAVVFEITGEAGGVWSMRRRAPGWELFQGEAEHAAARITTDADSAWRLFFHQFPLEEAERRVTITGDLLLGEIIFHTRSVMV
jgi:uncharacterized protein (TIGR03083 family)